jgi:3-isopropylmalate/(R)-2-methylmalate dehydratase small subunit
VEPFAVLQSRALRMAAPNIDTDQIVPARFLRNPRRAGYAGYLFHDLRFDAAGAPVAEFVFNRPEHQGARILLAGHNFGCGSSREGAVYALADWGIRCVIASSFGDIFRNNCFKNGVLPVVLPDAVIETLAAADGPLTVDLAAQTVAAGTTSVRFEIEPFWKESLLTGLDDIDLTLRLRARIDAFAAQHLEQRPWLRIPGR